MKHLHPLALLGVAAMTVSGAGASSSTTKVGLSVIGKPHASDLARLVAETSPISWYMTWSLYPHGEVARQAGGKAVEFLPMVHRQDLEGPGGAGTPGQPSLAARLPGPAGGNRLLTFNEPDGDVASGGTAMAPDDAARLYLEHVLPLRPRWRISHPTPTGSPRGLAWLRAFVAACEARNPGVGCPADFVSLHWYGDLNGLRWWMGELAAFYRPRERRLGFWLTELALPGQDAHANLAFLRDAVGYLKDLDYVEGYAWFGAYRTTEANAWVGAGASLLDSTGKLTDLGKSYLKQAA